MGMILPTWFGIFSYKEDSFKTFCPPGRTSFPPAGNDNGPLNYIVHVFLDDLNLTSHKNKNLIK